MQLAIEEAARQELIRRRGAGAGAIDRPTPIIPRRAAGTPPPMTAEQRHVWLHAQTAPDAPIYNEPFTLRLPGQFDPQAFLRAFDALIARHEALRTCFSVLDGDPVQVVHDDLHADFPVVDLTDLPPEERAIEARMMAQADARKPFALDRAPLFRGRLVRMAEDDHRLYLTLHHIIIDGSSIHRVMMPELAALYAAFARGDAPDLAQPPVQYGDYAAWQGAAGRDERTDAEIAYWRRTLASPPPALELPADRPQLALGSARGALATLNFDAGLVARLKALARARGVTFHMALLASFFVLLHRYSGQEDLIVGGLVDTRRRPDLAGMIGYCLNAVPLRARPTPDLPFSAFLAQVRDVVMGAVENGAVPFEQVVRSVRADRSEGRHPFFQTLISLEPPKPELPGGWSLTQHEVSADAAKLDLYIELDESSEGVAGRVTYRTDLFESATIAGLIDHWTTLLTHIAAAPETPLRLLGMMPPGEETRIVDLARGRQRPLDDATIHGLVRDMAATRPDAPAVSFGGAYLTYGELIERVDTLAAQLRLAGVEAGTLVGLCVTRSVDMVVAALAIMSRGAAYLPLDPSFPPARLTAVVEDAEPVAIVTQAALAPQLPGWGSPVVLCDRVPDLTHLALLPLPTDPNALAYVMYTSGSTGVPKGVEIRHRSVVNVLRAMQREPGFGDGDGLLAVTTPTFDISVLELFLPLISGGVLTIATAREAADPELLAAAIERSRCTVMQATPATWQNLFATGWAGARGLRVLCGGEALPRELAGRMLAADMELWNVYGPTETTIWSSAARVTAADDVTIGRPIDNTLMLVLDPDGRPQPFAVPGELHIGGAGLARGYRDPALTARAFIETARFGRLYRTGDIARLRRDGRFEWLGRRDGQVKIRGLRIDLGDIEAALAAHPQVAMAAVRTFDDEAGQKSLAAYIVPVSGRVPSATELRDFLRRALPPYMVPARYAAIPALPLSTNGKVARKDLPDPASGDSPPAASEPPCGETEIALAALWMDLLGVDTIGANDDFHELGGHSLLAARLMAQIERRFGRRLPLSTLLHAPTLRAMAAHLHDEAPPPPAPNVVTIKPGSSAPLFWIDAVPSFRPACYRALAAGLGRERPLIGLPVDIDRHDGFRRTGSLADLAGDVVAMIRSHDRHGPYLLGGWCSGGILAYAVAAQLLAEGADVAFLVLLDTVNPTTVRSRAAWLASSLRHLWRLPPGRRGLHAREVLDDWVARLARRFQRDRAETAPLVATNERFAQLAAAYDPAPLAAPVLLLQPRDDKRDLAAGWRTVLGPSLETVDIAGGYASVLDPPYVAGLGATLEERLCVAAR